MAVPAAVALAAVANVAAVESFENQMYVPFQMIRDTKKYVIRDTINLIRDT